MWPCSRRAAAVFQAIDAGMMTPSPRIAAAVAMPINFPETSMKAPPANPSCIGAVVRMTSSIERPRPVRSGPPITETIPMLAVTELLHDRAIAIARLPTRTFSPVASGAASRPGTFSSARPVAGSQPCNCASSGRPSCVRTRKPSARPSAQAFVITTSPSCHDIRLSRRYIHLRDREPDQKHCDRERQRRHERNEQKKDIRWQVREDHRVDQPDSAGDTRRRECRDAGENIRAEENRTDDRRTHAKPPEKPVRDDALHDEPSRK